MLNWSLADGEMGERGRANSIAGFWLGAECQSAGGCNALSNPD